jgi:hypothetical protein
MAGSLGLSAGYTAQKEKTKSLTTEDTEDTEEKQKRENEKWGWKRGNCLLACAANIRCNGL